MKALVAVKRVVDYNVKVRVKWTARGGHRQRQDEHEPL
jgi:electron transfer flavoprotein alpha/beta subunit